MYSYLLYPYIGYKIYEISNIIDYTIIIGKGFKRIYNWSVSDKKVITNNDDKYTDWIFIDNYNEKDTIDEKDDFMILAFY